MKKIILALICAVVSAGAYAQGKLTVNTGFLSPSTLNATIGYEHSFSYGNAVEVFGEIGNHWRTSPVSSGKDTTGMAASSTSIVLPDIRTACYAFVSGRSSEPSNESASSARKPGLNTITSFKTVGSSR